LFPVLNKVFKICFFVNIGLLAYGTWLNNFDLIALSIINMLLLTPAFVKENNESK
jgi:predicted Kef-type K+ transport protein